MNSKKRSMDAMEDVLDGMVWSSDQFGSLASAVVKGRRTKRRRMVAVAPATSASSSAEISGSTTEEEEDMAQCLILLAQGRGLELDREVNPNVGAGEEEEEEVGGWEKPVVARKAREYVYQCKTCSKCFPSFQALGGHRTSHKKPKISLLGESSKAVLAEEDAAAACSSIPKPTAAAAAATTAPPSNNYSSSKPRTHECSICGAEFSSGQALGGHMRRHRPLTPAENHPEAKKDKCAFLLDLNLPAPQDDPNSPPPPPPAAAVAFSFETQPSLVFSASALVDCHY